MTDWVWDEVKSRSNLAKRGIDFGLAQAVFDDPLAATRFEMNDDGEDRWQTIGMIGNVSIILSHTMAEDGRPGRIISARHATRQERKKYEEGDF
jgi:uncharacterized protein